MNLSKKANSQIVGVKGDQLEIDFDAAGVKKVMANFVEKA